MFFNLLTIEYYRDELSNPRMFTRHNNKQNSIWIVIERLKQNALSLFSQIQLGTMELLDLKTNVNKRKYYFKDRRNI